MLPIINPHKIVNSVISALNNPNANTLKIAQVLVEKNLNDPVLTQKLNTYATLLLDPSMHNRLESEELQQMKNDVIAQLNLTASSMQAPRNHEE